MGLPVTHKKNNRGAVDAFAEEENGALADSDNAVLVIGGGIAGIKASLDLAEAGRKVYIIDKSPALGGFLPLLDRQFPTNDCQICYLSPELAQSGFGLDIEVMPLTQVVDFKGEPGDFEVRLRTEPRYIDTNLCTACGACVEAAPEGAVRFTPGLDHRTPTCMRYPQAVPLAYSIDIEKVGRARKWLEVCQPGAIDLKMQPSEALVKVGAVIVATGAELFDPTPLQDLNGYGLYEDVITSLEFERILSASGPTGGRFTRPSDGKEPKHIGWIQCVGSRTTRDPGKPYCSSICCMFAMKEAAWAKEHFADDLKATVFFMDMRPMGKDYELYYQRMKNELGVDFVRCRPHTVSRDAESGEMVLTYMNEEGELAEVRMDLVVLATGFCAPSDAQELAQILDVELDRHQFIQGSAEVPVATSRSGIYACGMALGPRDIPDSLVQASSAVAMASSHLAQPQVPDPEADMPAERDTRDEEPKVGVFLSDFGGRVKEVVDFKKIITYFKKRPDVALVEELEFSWTSDGLERMVQSIKENGLNRVVVAGCSPRSHSTLFGETVRKAGLNKAFVELANIREQDAWVHGGDPKEATTKAIELIRMSVAGVRAAQPIYTHRQPINQKALVVGGGTAGMTAALSLAGQGTQVYLVEREKELGGLRKGLRRSLEGAPVQPILEGLIQRVKDHPRIEVITEALVVDHEGQLGDFTTGVQSGPGLYYQELKHGVTILATGARLYQPSEYLYGKDSKVMTQLELEQLLAKGDGSDALLQTVVMIQCVGSRNEENPLCGRICCRGAVKNALWLKELNPDAQIIVLYRDMRMPYVAEEAYRQAREQGVLFVRYTPEDPPQVEPGSEGLRVQFIDPILQRPLSVNPSALVLSVPQVAVDEDTEELAEIFRLQRGEGGFMLEEHVKLKPVDSPIPGVFLAGSVLAPKSLSESQTQGLAAAGRALTVLARESLALEGGVAKVTPELCASCLVCVRACPFAVPFINADGYSEIDPARCLGCGVCAAECPAKAIQLQGYSDDQIMERTDALLEGVL
jgi:heterodisulfide reductase subunit A